MPGMLSGELSGEDEARFRQLIQADEELRLRWEEYSRIWEGAGDGSRKTYDLDAEWDSLKDKLPGFGIGEYTSPVAADQDRGIPGTKEKRSFLYYTYRIAAILVVGRSMALPCSLLSDV